MSLQWDQVSGPQSAYVAMGDSRAAGPSNLSILGADGCGRTNASYPYVLHHLLRNGSFRDVSCVGATTDQITACSTHYNPRPLTVPAQVEALSTRTTLVTMSLGGNDVVWSKLLKPCFSLIPGRDQVCRDSRVLAAEMTERLSALAPALDTALSAVRDRAPNAHVVLVGHGGYYAPRGHYPRAPMSDADAVFVLGFFTRLNEVLRDAASRVGAAYVDVQSAAVGHECTAPREERWFEGNATFSRTPSRHPTPIGSAAIAHLIYDQLRALA